MVYDAMSGASPLYFNTLSGASGVGDHRVPHGRRRRRSRSTSTAGPSSVGALVFVTSATTCRAAGRSTCSTCERRQEPHVAARRRRHARPHQRDQRRGAQLGSADSIDVRARRHAGARRRRHRSVEPHVLTRARLLQRPVQAARHAARRRARPGPGSRATTSTSPVRTRRCSWLPPAARLLAAVAHAGRRRWVQPLPQGFTVTPALRFYHADRGRSSTRTRRWPTGSSTASRTTARIRACGVRRDHSRRERRGSSGRLVVRCRARRTIGRIRLALCGDRQPRHPAVLRALDPGGRHQDF